MSDFQIFLPVLLLLRRAANYDGSAAMAYSECAMMHSGVMHVILSVHLTVAAAGIIATSSPSQPTSHRSAVKSSLPSKPHKYTTTRDDMQTFNGQVVSLVLYGITLKLNENK